MSDPKSKAAVRSAAEIKKEAGDWLERHDRPDWSEVDQRAFDAWLGESPAHLLAYHRIAQAWNQAERLVALRRHGPDRAGSEGGARPTVVKIAAMIVLVTAFVTGGVYFLSPPGGRTFETSLGGHEIVRLSDGSRIELNTNTAVHVDLSAGRRMASLEKGEAYFEIAHDASRPFTVKVANHRITVLGTKFRVLDAPNRVEVALLDGRVWFDTDSKDKQQSALLSPGQVLVATARGITVTSQPARSLANDLSWRNGLLSLPAHFARRRCAGIQPLQRAEDRDCRRQRRKADHQRNSADERFECLRPHGADVLRPACQ